MLTPPRRNPPIQDYRRPAPAPAPSFSEEDDYDEEAIMQAYGEWNTSGRPRGGVVGPNMNLDKSRIASGYNPTWNDRLFPLIAQGYKPQDAYRISRAKSQDPGTTDAMAVMAQKQALLQERRAAGELQHATPDGRLRPGWKVVNGKPVRIADFRDQGLAGR
jgi:hypothetical protein